MLSRGSTCQCAAGSLCGKDHSLDDEHGFSPSAMATAIGVSGWGVRECEGLADQRFERSRVDERRDLFKLPAVRTDHEELVKDVSPGT
jgi:hypothetical protein